MTSGGIGFTAWNPGRYVVAVEGRSVPVTRAQQPGVRVPLSEQELMAFLTTFHPSALVEPAAQRIQLAPGRDAVGIDIAAVRARRFRVSGVRARLAGRTSRLSEWGPQPRWQPQSTSQGFTSDARWPLYGCGGRTRRVQTGHGWRNVDQSPRLDGTSRKRRVADDRATDLDDVVVITQPGISLSGRVVLTDAPPPSAPRLQHFVPPRRQSDVRSPDIEATIGDDLRFQGRQSLRSETGARVRLVRAAGRSRPSC